jgi:hypothetical protein
MTASRLPSPAGARPEALVGAGDRAPLNAPVSPAGARTLTSAGGAGMVTGSASGGSGTGVGAEGSSAGGAADAGGGVVASRGGSKDSGSTYVSVGSRTPR